MDFQILSWPMLGLALLVFGFAPGLLLRLIVLAFPRMTPAVPSYGARCITCPGSSGRSGSWSSWR
jgi:hypothetical protein